MKLTRTVIGIVLAIAMSLLVSSSWSAQEGNLDAPIIEIPEPTYDWGEVPKGEVVTHPFTVLNKGAAPLQINKVQSD